MMIGNHESYSLYRPTAKENPQFVDMQPPSTDENEPNYYSIKPRKFKKYLSKNVKAKKYNKPENIKEQIVQSDEEKIDDQEKIVDQEQIDDHEPSPSENFYDEYDLPHSSEEIITSEKITNGKQDLGNEAESSERSTDESIETSQPSSRLDFQMHGNWLHVDRFNHFNSH